VLIESPMSASEQTCGMAQGDAATQVIEVKWSLVGNLDNI